jgi:hypothetical protein
MLMLSAALQDTFSSWEEQNMHDTQFIIDYFKNSSVVIIGDLNTGPKITLPSNSALIFLSTIFGPVFKSPIITTLLFLK